MSEWKKWEGGILPCNKDAIVEVKQRNGQQFARYARECYWGRMSDHSHDIIEYRIVEAPREPVKTVTYTAHSKMWGPRSGNRTREEAMASYVQGAERTGNVIVEAIETIHFEDGIPVSSTFERVK